MRPPKIGSFKLRSCVDWHHPRAPLTEAETVSLQVPTRAGEYTDAETGFVYLRARYYDPATGQFISRDPLTAMTGSPYGYVDGNPLNSTDPLGLCVAGLFGRGCKNPVQVAVHILGDGVLGAVSVVGAVVACTTEGVVTLGAGCVAAAAVAVAGVTFALDDAINTFNNYLDSADPGSLAVAGFVPHIRAHGGLASRLTTSLAMERLDRCT